MLVPRGGRLFVLKDYRRSHGDGVRSVGRCFDLYVARVREVILPTFGSAPAPFMNPDSLQRFPSRAALPGATSLRAFPLQCSRHPCFPDSGNPDWETKANQGISIRPALLRFFASHRRGAGPSNPASAGSSLSGPFAAGSNRDDVPLPVADPHGRAAIRSRPAQDLPVKNLRDAMRSGTAPGIWSLRSFAPASRLSGVSAVYPCVPFFVRDLLPGQSKSGVRFSGCPLPTAREAHSR